MFYRFSVDDNIRFLQELTEGEYRSVFEHPYLKMYKDLHEKYGTKVQLNLFYTMNGFDLSMMTDKYKDEWQKNSDWLRFSFHSYSDGPPFPYKESEYEEVYRDCQLVHSEIRRFAGEECLSYFITVHYCQASPEAIRALRDCGIKGMVGLFKETECYGRSYDGSVMTVEYDEELGMYLFCNDIILNLYPLSMVEELLSRDDHKEFTEVMIHEQYFYPTYGAFIPNYSELIFTACKWCRDNGYEPAFTSQVIQ